MEKIQIVQLISNKKTEEALRKLAKNYRVPIPRLQVGLPKGHKKNILACYSPKNQTISVVSSEVIGNPFVILHEFYHHVRTSVDRKHKGTERNADRFANDFILEYKKSQALAS